MSAYSQAEIELAYKFNQKSWTPRDWALFRKIGPQRFYELQEMIRKKEERKKRAEAHSTDEAGMSIAQLQKRQRTDAENYWSKTPQEPSWTTGTAPPFATTSDPDADAMRDLYWQKWYELRDYRIQLRGSPQGVSMPQYSLEDFWNNPAIMDCYLTIEKWKVEQAKQARRRNIQRKK